MKFKSLPKLHKGDKVAILSPSFAAPGMFPELYELGISRLKDIFGLVPVEYPSTRKLGASKEERTKDLIDAFENKEIKAVIATIGGNDQVTYIKNLPSEPFKNNPKPYFGFSDNTHMINHLWLNGIPSFYGGSIMTQYAMQGEMNEYTVEYLKKMFFEEGEIELKASDIYNDISLEWGDLENLKKSRVFEPNEGWYWDGTLSTQGTTWGGCLESLDEILRNGVEIPSLEDFKDVILFLETSEEVPSREYVHRVLRALGERGILENIKGVVVGRPKAWNFDIQNDTEEKKIYKEEQREIILKTVREYNKEIPVIQNFDIGHTDPQIALPVGKNMRINSKERKVFVEI